MNPVIKNILAFLAGFIFGSLVNMGIIMVSGSIIPPPNGADVTTMEGLKASMHLFKPKHFILPFLAHALGTFAGSFLVTKVVSNHKLKFALGIGAMFLIGGIVNVIMLPSPIWFTALDLLCAYIPMSILAERLALK